MKKLLLFLPFFLPLSAFASVTINGQCYNLLWNPFTGSNQYVDCSSSLTYVNYSSAAVSYLGISSGTSSPGSLTLSSASVSYLGISSVTLSVVSSSMTVRISTGNAYARVGGSYFDHFVTTGNTNTTETDLYQENIASNVLVTNGDCLEVRYGGSFVGSGVTTRDLRFYVTTTTVFDTGGVSVTANGDWRLEGTLCKDSGTTLRSTFSLNTGGASTTVYTQTASVGGLQFTGSNTFKLTGQSVGIGGATNDVTAKLGKGFFWPSVN